MAAYLSQRGNNPTPLLPRRPTQSQRYQSRACNLDTPQNIHRDNSHGPKAVAPQIAAVWNSTTQPLHIIWTQKDNIMEYMALVDNETDIMQHVLKMQ